MDRNRPYLHKQDRSNRIHSKNGGNDGYEKSSDNRNHHSTRNHHRHTETFPLHHSENYNGHLNCIAHCHTGYTFRPDPGCSKYHRTGQPLHL